MTAPAAQVDVLSPRRHLADSAVVFFLRSDLILAFLRRWLPIVAFGKFAMVFRNDDVREVLLRGPDFPVGYAEKLGLVMHGQPFFLALDGQTHTRGVDAMRLVMTRDDIAVLARETAQRCAARVSASNGTIEIVDFVRQVTLEVFCDYLGVADLPGYDLRVVAQRLFEFVLFDMSKDKALRAEVEEMAAALRDHLDRLIAARKAQPLTGDDVLGRCLQQQAQGVEGFSDIEVRTALVGFLFGGLPQPQMAVPQALEQLFKRPEALAQVQACARANDGPGLAGYVFEALRFRPVALALMRRTTHSRKIADGLRRVKTIKAGVTVVAALGSAMRDPRRVRDPKRFDPTRPWSTFMLFGAGPHTCFAEQINKALIPVFLKALLTRRDLQPAPGGRGKLRMRGYFAERLWVTFTP